MTQTVVIQALESLSLQRERHLKEEAVIRHKQRCHQMVNKYSQYRQERPRSKTPLQEESEGATLTNGEISINQLASTITTVDENLLVYRTMEECDSLLQFLKNRTATAGKPEPPKASKYTSSQNKKQLFQSGTKIPIDDQLIIEELRMHNDALREHILELLTECDLKDLQANQYKKENEKLVERLRKLESQMSESNESEKCYPLPSRMSVDDLPSMELPPLEMPTFDFDKFKLQDDGEEGDSQNSL